MQLKVVLDHPLALDAVHVSQTNDRYDDTRAASLSDRFDHDSVTCGVARVEAVRLSGSGKSKEEKNFENISYGALR